MTRWSQLVHGSWLHVVWIPVLGVAGTGVFYYRHASSRPPAASAVPVASASTAAPKLPTFSVTGWERGTEYVHGLDYRFHLAQGDRQALAVQPALHVSGVLRSVVVAGIERGVRLRVELQGVSLETPDPAATRAAAPTARALMAPFYVDYDERGRARELHARPDTDRTALGIARELVSLTQFSRPEPPAASWQALETDMAGEYRADYRWLNRDAFTRTKLRYVTPTAAGRNDFGAGAATIREASSAFKLDDWGRVAELEAKQELTTPDAENGAGFASRTELRLSMRSKRQGVEASADLTGLTALGLAPDANDAASATDDLDRQLVGNADVAQLLGELDALGDADRDGAFGVQVRLAALFRRDSSAIDKALARLDAKNAATILGALGAAGTPLAQKALAAVVGDNRRDSAQRQLALDSMLSVEHPTAELRSALRKIASLDDSELKHNASMMLGVMASRDSDPQAAAAIVEQMSRELQSAKTSDARIHAVNSLGNTRSDAALPAIAEALGGDDAQVRSAAAAALRFVQDPQADRLLSKALTSDPSPDVRSAALLAAGYRAYDPLAAALEHVSKQDPNPAVRSQAVGTLASMTRQDNQSLILLDWIAQHDTDPKVRDRARAALDSAAL